MPGSVLVGVLVGEAPTPEKAASIAATYRPCPYCGLLVSTGCAVIGVFSLPPGHRWWLEWVADHPQETLGLRRGEVFFTDRVDVWSPWARGEVKPCLEQAPCGAVCRECPAYGNPCRGCPATRHAAHLDAGA